MLLQGANQPQAPVEYLCLLKTENDLAENILKNISGTFSVSF